MRTYQRTQQYYKNRPVYATIYSERFDLAPCVLIIKTAVSKYISVLRASVSIRFDLKSSVSHGPYGETFDTPLKSKRWRNIDIE